MMPLNEQPVLTHERTIELLTQAWGKNIEMANLLEASWGIIANADWDAPGNSTGWKEAAETWRDKYHALLPEPEGPAEVEVPA